MRLQKSAWALVLILSGGCYGEKAAPPAVIKPAGEHVESAVKAPVFDKTKGYLHKASGVGFIYPVGWQHEQPNGDETDTSLGLFQPQIAIITMFWTEVPAAPPDFAQQIGQLKYNDYKDMYKDKVSPPKAITIGGQPGFEIPIKAGPGGDTSTDAVGADFVFAVHHSQRTWSIELRASAKDEKTLDSIRTLLSNYKVLP